MKPFQQFIF